MKVFLDANVLISVLNKEYPLFTYSARIISLSDHRKFQLYTSPLSLAIAFYFASKKSGERLAKKKITLLAEKIHLTTISETITQKALKDPKVHDFEDGMQYYSAVEKSCEVLITEDQEDFYFSEIEVLGCQEFISNHC